ncbi:hypothetical protein TVAG_016390 [Trichomonas vaginalis G3]|uniref:Uncharacterized protein n=1 Tax=Trichomonas vaginalis (strain ATCC PRA-98 / G3) TaxID=412133 RepID=A2DPA9_TRIV3|nr:lectin leg-like domain-containing protein [Trichomonas vaginalis G3]EAY17809.1 hypothetical protein TVAG_016390 [Trichomonas vaginalis G3]KAI5484366.1 lectin leg-like domain-containing protein [Trichomonas vaginalis G3]|eukprot:XP_001329944.1 hypothetical protein [Trichomonas vaginalis G3]
MFLYSLFLAATDSEYQLSVPFLRTLPGEIGNWTLRGQAVAQKRVIHLTTAIPSVFGGICSRTPTNAKDWSTNLDFSLDQDEFYITLSRNVCPDPQSWFSGMNITFVPLENGSVSFSVKGNEVIPPRTNIIDNFNFSKQHTVQIVKKGRNIEISYENELQFNVSTFGAYDQTYFSFFAQSPVKCNRCITNIHGFTYIPTSERRKIDESLDQRNRKALRTTANKRETMKMMRRAVMQVVSQYIEEALGNDDNFTGQSVQLKDSLAEIKETILRANHTVSSKQLKQLIDEKISPVLEKSYHRFENVANAMFSTKMDMVNIWRDTGNQLRQIRSDLSLNCVQIENEARKYIFQVFKLAPEEFHEDNHENEKENLSFYLGIICLIEFIAYCIFFLRYHFVVLSKKRE